MSFGDDVDDVESRSKRCIEFLLLIGKMKTNKRTGWVDNKVNLPESIADHSYRFSIAALLAAPYFKNTSPERCALIGLAHDIAECITGDIVPHDPMGKKAKQQLEQKAMQQLQKGLELHSQQNVFHELWQEYETQTTNEGILCKDLDKIEMAIQAFEYEQVQPHLDLSCFYASVKDKLKTEEISSWFKELMRKRAEFRLQKPLPGKYVRLFQSINTSSSIIFGVGFLFGISLSLYITRGIGGLNLRNFIKH